MSRALAVRGAHALVARGASSGTIAGATVGGFAAVVLMLICSLPFILKFRRKRRLRQRQEQHVSRPDLAPSGTRPNSHVFTPPHNRFSQYSQSRVASVAATLSDHESQIGKEYAADGITYHRSAAPSPALVGKTLRTCSPAPSIAMVASSASLAAVSLNNSPAVAQGPFPPPPKTETGITGTTTERSATFGTLTTEPEPLSRSATGSQHEPQSPAGGAFRKFHAKLFHRGSTKSSASGSESHKTRTRSSERSFDDYYSQPEDPPPAPYLLDDKPLMGGSAEEYYSGAPLSPPEESSHPQLLHLMAMPGASFAGVGAPQTNKPSNPQSLASPFNSRGAPMSPTSPDIKDEESSSETGGKGSFEAANGDSLSPSQRGLTFESSPKRPEPPPSPSHPAPGTVNPMDMMKPSTAEEQAAWVDTELWKLENSPPPQLDNSPPPQSQPSHSPQPAASAPSHIQPASQPERPQFQAVVRHPTQMDLGTNGQVVPHHDEQIITDISDTSSPGPAFDQYAYGASPSNHTSPETRLTESAYTGTPSPRSSISNRPSSSYNGTDYLGTSPGHHSRTSSQGENSSPRPTSFACEECGSKFDQVHKLNHHKRYHERPHQCSQCDKRFGTKTHLDRHVNDKHNKTRKYHCTIPGCAYAKQGGGKSFPRKDNWRRHMTNKHSVQNPPEPVEEDVSMTGA